MKCKTNRALPLLLTLALCCFGVGIAFTKPARAPAKRIDAPFTVAVETPHVSWGKPWAGAPVHALVVPSVSEGRTLVELAERFPLTYDTVMIDSAWDVNTWTVGTDKNYEARNYKLLYRYLAEDLTSKTHYDVIVLPSLFGWNRLPQVIRDAILRRVQEGAGLVLIHPTTGIPAPDDPKTTRPLNDFAPDYAVSPGGKLWELSPLVDVLSDRLDNHGFLQVRPDAIAPGAWRVVHPGFITDNVPFAAFPADYLKHYKYRLGRDSTALVVGPGGEPIVATKMYGKGRVVALGYLNHGLSPVIDWSFLGRQDDHWWEYFYSMLGRSIIWAAQREPRMVLLPMTVRAPARVHAREALRLRLRNSTRLRSADLSVNVVNEWGEREGTITKRVKLRKGLNGTSLELPAGLSAGQQYADVILLADGRHYDWGSAAFSLPQPARILSITTDKSFYSLGDQLQATVRTEGDSPAGLRVELLDNRGRLIGVRKLAAAKSPDHKFQAVLPVGNYSTNIGWVRASLFGPRKGKDIKLDQSQARINFVSLDRKFGAYELILPWYGPPSYEPWVPALEAQFRKIGVTVVENPRNNFRIIAQVHAPGFGVYWHYRRAYIQQKDNYLRTHDTKYLVREPDLSSHAWLDKLRGLIIQAMQKDIRYRPLAYYLADESSLTAYGDPLDFSWSGPTLTAFRRWLKGQYASLDALNREWETNFKNWDEVTPLTTAQAQVKGDYAGWMDHRTFMEQVFAHAVEVAAETVKAEDPGGLPSISGTQAPGPSNAVNWYLLDHIVGYLQPYSGDDQDDLHRSIHAGQILTGFTGYGSAGVELRHELWHRLFHGQIGASLFWQYTALNADLTMTQQGRDLAALTNEFRNEGLALLLRGAHRDNCGIAVHYSLLSVRGNWITDGHIAAGEVTNGDATSAHLKRFHRNRTEWLQALRDAGYQYDFLTTEQIDKGGLSNYRVLILPDSIALSKSEATAIRSFVERGGLLISNGETGLMDGHARWQREGLLDDVLGVDETAARLPSNTPTANARGSEVPNPGRAPTPQVPRAPYARAAVKLRVGIGGKVTELDAIPCNADLKVTTGRPDAIAGKTPFLIENSFGAGRSIALNSWLTNYASLRKERANTGLLSALEYYLSRAGIRPVADVHTARGTPLGCSEVTGYSRGDIRYLSILPGLGCSDEGKVAVQLPKAEYVYDLRAHRLVGHTSTVSGTLVDGEPLFLALAPEPLGRLSVQTAGPRQVKAGGTIAFAIHLSKSPGIQDFPEAVHVEVSNPRGKTIGYYSKSLPLARGEARFSIRTALNDVPGTWTVRVREPYTHQTITASFTLTH